MSGAILISDRIKHHPLLRCLPEFKVSRPLPSNTGPDLIFPECLPSLAVILLDYKTEKRSEKEMMLQLGEVQSKFKNAYAIILNCDITKWNDIQSNICGGKLRLLRCESYSNAAKNLMEIYSALKDSEKLQMQKSYFEREEIRLNENQTARNIAMTSFSKLGIPENDGNLIIDGFPSIKKVIAASFDTLSANSPADQSSIEKIVNFFGADISK